MIIRVTVGPARCARSNGEAHVRPLTYAYLILNFGGLFGEFRAIHALSRAKSRS